MLVTRYYYYYYSTIIIIIIDYYYYYSTIIIIVIVPQVGRPVRRGRRAVRALKVHHVMLILYYIILSYCVDYIVV